MVQQSQRNNPRGPVTQLLTVRQCLICAALFLVLFVALLVSPLPAADTGTGPMKNGKIAYTGNGITTINPDGTELTQLTIPDERVEINRDPAWFPGGKRIAFISSRDGMGEIYTMSADGSNQGRLTYNGAIVKHKSMEMACDKISLSPDSSRIAFFNRDHEEDKEIHVVSSDGLWQTQLTDNDGWDSSPDFSPDGTKIAFTSERDAPAAIYMMNSDGTDQRRLTEDGSGPDFSPDGTKIVFSSDSYDGSRDSRTEIYLINVDGSGLTRLTHANGNDKQPTFSPDGTKIAFTSKRKGFGYLYTMNADGTEQTMVSKELIGVTCPSWQPLDPDEADEDWDSDEESNPSSLKLKVKLSPRKPKTYPRIRIYVTQNKKKTRTLKNLEIELGEEPDPMRVKVARLARKGKAKRKGKRIGRIKLTPVKGVTVKAHVYGKRGRLYFKSNKKQLRSLRRKVTRLKKKRGRSKSLKRARSDLRKVRSALKHLTSKTKLRLRDDSLKITRLPKKKYRRIYLSINGRKDRILKTPKECDTVTFTGEFSPYKGDAIEAGSRVRLSCASDKGG